MNLAVQAQMDETKQIVTHQVERTCIGCKRIREKSKLLRVAKLKGDGILVDVKQRLGGRGVYVCPTWECIVAAHRRRGLESSFKQAISERVYEELLKHASLATGDWWKPTQMIRLSFRSS